MKRIHVTTNVSETNFRKGAIGVHSSGLYFSSITVNIRISGITGTRSRYLINVAGEEELEDRSCGVFVLTGSDFELSMVTLDDLVAYPEAEAGTLYAFGSEEGFEDLVREVGRDT